MVRLHLKLFSGALRAYQRKEQVDKEEKKNLTYAKDISSYIFNPPSLRNIAINIPTR